jgi:O-antigen/teichoic acid export membrane protein
VSVIAFIFVLICCGVGAAVVKNAPDKFLDQTYKSGILWVILVVAVVCLLWTVWTYLPLLHLPGRH